MAWHQYVRLYMEKLKLVGLTTYCISLSKVEQFWAYYIHMAGPGDLTGHADLHIFKDGIKPMWEVSVNAIHAQPRIDNGPFC
eukprot:m.33910 g.33910  ORF g.33910 m.33910 type:complete len:82 (+) comp31926_c0_seq3:725-970(+)